MVIKNYLESVKIGHHPNWPYIPELLWFSCDSILIGRKTFLQISTRSLAYHWEWSTTTQHLFQSPHHCLPQNRIPKGHPSTLPPSQSNIPTFCYQQTPTIITTDTLLIIMQPSSQPTPLNRHTPFEKGYLISRMGASTNPKPTYTSLLSCTSCSSTPCPTHSSSTLQKLGIPNHVVFTTNSGRTKQRAHILMPRQLYLRNHMATLNQSTAISLHKRTQGYLIWLKHATF